MTQSAHGEIGPSLPGRGEFGGQAVLGAFQPDAASMHSDEPLFGVPPGRSPSTVRRR